MLIFNKVAHALNWASLCHQLFVIIFTLNNFNDNFLIKGQIPHYYRSASELTLLVTGKDKELLILLMHVSSLIVLVELKYVRKTHKLLLSTHYDLAKYKQ